MYARMHPTTTTIAAIVIGFLATACADSSRTAVGPSTPGGALLSARPPTCGLSAKLPRKMASSPGRPDNGYG